MLGNAKFFNKSAKSLNIYGFLQSTNRLHSTTISAPSKIEVFIDEKKVLVDPGMTILQV